MCTSCGCCLPSTTHGDRRHITVEDLRAAADAANTTVETVAHNIESYAMHHHGVRKADEARHASDGPSLSVQGPEPSGSDCEVLRIAGVLKSSDEDQYLLTVVYSPNRMPIRGADGKTDVASPRVLEKACWMWMAKGAKTGMWHETGHDHEAVCVESYIYRNPVPWVVKHPDGTETVIKEGDWLAGFVLSNHAWGLYKSGRIGAVSMQGDAGRKAPSAETLARVKGDAA